MPLQNRVLPDGNIVAIPARGTLTGNRGIIHRDDQTLGISRWSHHAWICCTLDWQGRKRKVMHGRKWTELFFLDEAVALAAGHRPCGYCRRPAYNAYVDAWTRATGTRPKAAEMDKELHAARIVTSSRTQKTYESPIQILPYGTIIWHAEKPHLVSDNKLHPYTPSGYGGARPRPATGTAVVMTPAPTVAVLSCGYRPNTHATAGL